ncbi:peptidase S8/S53 domain-containing protein [Lophiotrema nucula]|uniref:tripeptidyl-peptidase II n=1 Tax=Lophiotrema nucula TaxID=690887 RepID=A0A6A5ZDL6_9PLEO|nr:peptidase S8/S53 domain-containing protein [Lophiotrema nucula]
MLSTWARGSILSLILASGVAGAVFEKLNAVPDGWKFLGHASDNEAIRLQIALKQGDVEAFEQAVIDMSTPEHPNYGKHFQDHDEMKRMLLPSDESLHSVLEWLQQGGVEGKEDSDWVDLSTTVGVANELLSTKFGWYFSEDFGKRLRTLEYSVPEEISEHINTIQPTIRFGQGRPNHATSQVLPDDEIFVDAAAAANATACNTTITPQCLQQLYKIDYKASTKSGSKIAFCSYLEESARYADLELFEENIAQYALGENYTIITYNGGINDQTSANDSGEANLDGQYMVGLGSPLPVTEYITAGRGPLIPDLDQPDPANNGNEPYLDFLKNVLKLPQSKLPQVISTSYGEDEQSVPESYAKSVCNLYAQLGSRGVSVLFSSGDNGVGTACQSNDGKNVTKFQPQFPAACPWVTSVGSTRFLDEQATFFSSGGFSNYWSTPAWQVGAVKGYLSKIGKTWKGLYNPNGRGFPDVAAQGVGYSVYDKGTLKHYQGTSCSSPAFGAIVGLLNDARLKAHLPPMGFLNPWIYSVGPKVLNDIAKGGSTGCDGHARFHGPPNGSPVVPYASWNATKGWDPVTGYGTPNFPKMLKAAVPSHYRA